METMDWLVDDVVVDKHCWLRSLVLYNYGHRHWTPKYYDAFTSRHKIPVIICRIVPCGPCTSSKWTMDVAMSRWFRLCRPIFVPSEDCGVLADDDWNGLLLQLSLDQRVQCLGRNRTKTGIRKSHLSPLGGRTGQGSVVVAHWVPLKQIKTLAEESRIRRKSLVYSETKQFAPHSTLIIHFWLTKGH